MADHVHNLWLLFKWWNFEFFHMPKFKQPSSDASKWMLYINRRQSWNYTGDDHCFDNLSYILGNFSLLKKIIR
jgi:hypothetical protein